MDPFGLTNAISLVTHFVPDQVDVYYGNVYIGVNLRVCTIPT